MSTDAFPVAIGAKVAAPERPVVVYVGDGAFGSAFDSLAFDLIF